MLTRQQTLALRAMKETKHKTTMSAVIVYMSARSTPLPVLAAINGRFIIPPSAEDPVPTAAAASRAAN